MSMDKRYLGVFLLLSTQTGWVEDILPADGSKPADFTKTRLYDVGLTEYIQEIFYNAFSSTKQPHPDLLKQLVDLAASDTMRDIHRGLFDVVSGVLSNAPVNYTPPPCPAKVTLQYIIKAVNEAPMPIEDGDMARKIQS